LVLPATQASLLSQWSVVGPKGRTLASTKKPVQLVLEFQDKEATVELLQLQDIVNRKATKLGFKGLFALLTTKSGKNNLVI